MDFLANHNPPCSYYQVFMPGFLIVLDILPGVRLLSAEETWRQRFAQCVMKVTAPEDTHTCKYGQICVVLKVGIYG